MQEGFHLFFRFSKPVYYSAFASSLVFIRGMKINITNRVPANGFAAPFRVRMNENLVLTLHIAVA